MDDFRSGISINIINFPQIELQTRKEDLKRQREALQRQMDMMREQGHMLAAGDLDLSDDLDSGEHQDSGSSRPILAHRRSASADFCNNPALADGDSSSQTSVSRHPRLSTGNLGVSSHQAGAGGLSAKQAGLPMHLLSARNEQRLGGGNVQKLPLKLSGSTSVVTSVPQHHHHTPQTPGPSAAFSESRQKPYPRSGSSGLSRVQSMSSAHRPTVSQRHRSVSHLNDDNSRSAPSSLAQLMKLADPKAGKSSGNPTGKPPVPHSAGSPGAPGAPVGGEAGKDNSQSPSGQDIIYF